MRHNFSFAMIYELPFGKGRRFGNDATGVQNVLLGGWILNSIFQTHSGLGIDGHRRRGSIAAGAAEPGASEPPL